MDKTDGALPAVSDLVYLGNRKRKKLNTRRIKEAPGLINFRFPSHVLKFVAVEEIFLFDRLY